MRVLFDSRHRRFVLNQPGIYELKGVYQDSQARPETVLESNLVRLEVLAPPERERQAFQDHSDELGDSELRSSPWGGNTFLTRCSRVRPPS